MQGTFVASPVQGHLVTAYSASLTLLAPIPVLPPTLGCRSRYFRFAVQLKQVSHFYNHMTEAILPCQKELLLRSAEPLA